MPPPQRSEINSLIELVKELEPDLVGISLRSSNFKLASEITKEIKKEVDTLVIWGGIHPTTRPDQCLEYADIVCIGEGAGPIVDLATMVSQGEEIDDIQNLWIKKGDKIIKNDLRPMIQNLDSLPFPDFTSENKYLVEDGGVQPLPSSDQRLSYEVITSMGCPFSCTFCCNNILRRIYKGKGKYVRRRSVENVIEELVKANKIFKNLTQIAFVDDVFTSDINWIRKFCDQYKSVIRLPFSCYVHPRFVNEESIKLLKDAGLIWVGTGIQSGSEKTRHKYFERYGTNEEIVRSAQIVHKYKIARSYDIIMDNPLETEGDKRKTLDLLLRLPRPFMLHTHTLTHFPETKFTKLLLEKGLISENDVEDRRRKSCERWIPSLDLSRSREDLFWDNLYYLAKKEYAHRQIIVLLSRSNFLKKHPTPLTLLLKFFSSDIHTVVPGSKVDMMRWHIMQVIAYPPLLFRKRTWAYLWTRIKKKNGAPPPTAYNGG